MEFPKITIESRRTSTEPGERTYREKTYEDIMDKYCSKPETIIIGDHETKVRKLTIGNKISFYLPDNFVSVIIRKLWYNDNYKSYIYGDDECLPIEDILTFVNIGRHFELGIINLEPRRIDIDTTDIRFLVGICTNIQITFDDGKVSCYKVSYLTKDDTTEKIIYN